MSSLRVIFCNLTGCATKWFDVRLTPCSQFGDGEFSNGFKVEYRRELFQRFLFGVFRQVLIYSRKIFVFDGKPRICMVVADQTEERIIFGIRSASDTRDCTPCDMISKVPSFATRREISAKNWNLRSKVN